MKVCTTCPYCGVGCGVSVSRPEQAPDSADDLAKPPLVLASQSHPANLGRLCSKGSALSETLDKSLQPRRLTHPQIKGETVTWDEASSTIATKISQSIEDHGPDSVAFYLSGQLLTEDYYVANKLAKGFLGTANVDTNSRLCMSSAVAAYKRAFGSDTVPCSYQDLDAADLIVLVGSNAAWTHPVLYQRMVAAKEARPDLKIVLIDPRKTATADLADLHLAIKPSSDNFLFQGLLNYLVENSGLDQTYIENYTEGFETVANAVSGFDLVSVAQVCGVEQTALAELYQWFAETNKSITFYSQGINQSATGTDKCNAIINCHLASGKIGYAGAGPFSITGQPNAMGGREVGGLANMLAAHMEFNPSDIDRVQRFWQAPNMATQPGLKAIDLFDQVACAKVKVIWIMATNPAVSLPDSDRVRDALAHCETVIVSDVTHTDTSEFADILLPALGWGEKDGTVTNSERRISRQRAFEPAIGAAKADWWALAEVAKKMGYVDAFDYECSADVFSEHAQLSAFENQGSRDFDIGGLAKLSKQQYQDLEPIQWPVNEQAPHGTARMFTDGRYFTPSKKAQFIDSQPCLADAVEESIDTDKLLLNSGRLRDQWHTMTRTGHVPRLTAHDDVALVQVHPKDALKHGLKQNAVAELVSETGVGHFLVKITEAVRPGDLFTPIHWCKQHASKALTNSLVAARVDPVSGQPEFKASKVELRPLLLKNWVRVVTRTPLVALDDRFMYWSCNKVDSAYVSLLGYNEQIDWKAELADLSECNAMEYANTIAGSNGLILADDNDIKGLVFERDCASKLPGQTWLLSLFEGGADNASKRLRGEQGRQDEVICACFGTTRKNLDDAIEQGAKSQADLGQKLGCGSKCGSCKPELNQCFK